VPDLLLQVHVVANYAFESAYRTTVVLRFSLVMVSIVVPKIKRRRRRRRNNKLFSCCFGKETHKCVIVKERRLWIS
jgi:hypothetical protein